MLNGVYVWFVCVFFIPTRDNVSKFQTEMKVHKNFQEHYFNFYLFSQMQIVTINFNEVVFLNSIDETRNEIVGE